MQPFKSHPQPHRGLTTCRGVTRQGGRGRIVTLWIGSAISYSSPVLTYVLAEDLARAPGQLPYSAIAFCCLEIPLLMHMHMHMHTPWFKRDTEAVTAFCPKFLHSGRGGSSFSGTYSISVTQDMNYVPGKVIKTLWDPLEGRCNLEMKSDIKMSLSLTSGMSRASGFD